MFLTPSTRTFQKLPGIPVSGSLSIRGFGDKGHPPRAAKFRMSRFFLPRGEGAMIVLVVSMVWLAAGLTSCSGDSSDIPPPPVQETVAGIDANGDGVRDDIEAYIDATYPVSAQGDTNRALRQFARAAQVTMIDASEPAPSVAHAAERFRALECLMARRPVDFHLIFVELRARMLNTTARSLAYLQADNHVRAGNVPLLPADQWRGACL